ncbi:MAG: TAXI family TRAP transporter solute-binding subunit [Deltaproteobacteria bacterium]|nr:TAXI family TRAP transporter solute-binding subunit [Deltaproteobacteria bacterium]
MNIRRSVRLPTLGVFAAALLVAPHPASSQQQALPRSVNFGTHAVGTVFNAVGTGLAKVATDRGPIRVVVQPFSGPPAWIPTMNREGKPEIGIINVTEIWQAYTGKVTPRPLPAGAPEMKPPYTPQSNLRLLNLGTNLALGILVRADSPIKSLADLKGKRLTWDFPAFPANILSGLATLSTAGVSIQDVQPVPVPEVVSGVRALMEGRVDGAVAAVGMGIVSEADARVGVRFLPAGQGPEGIRVAAGIMPGGNVNIRRPGPAGVKGDTPLWSYGISIVASTHMSEETAYTILKAWWEHWKELEPVHPQFRGWNPDVFVQEIATIPYHSGAIKLYKEKGKWTANMAQNQGALLRGELPFLK